ncbi:MAG: class IV adenylate cyclase [Desulfovibrio sp.]|jgi:adenylate cyclase class 2|nr:class IV adenylate cyclase [Desulfovibrio sp.]
MAKEVERKYLGVARGELRPLLESLGAEPQGGAHFESNIVYDNEQGELVAGRRLLRLRTREWPDRSDARLTYKAPLPDVAVAGRMAKRREETEIGVSSARDAGKILLALGYRPVASYEKVRESWLLEGAHVDMDELPFMDVVEIEGSEAQIARLEKLLGLDKKPSSAKSYYGLYTDWLAERGRGPETSFAFSAERKASLRKALGLEPQA